VEDTYSGPKLDPGGIPTVEFMKELLDLYKEGGKLHKRFAYQVNFLGTCVTIQSFYFGIFPDIA